MSTDRAKRFVMAGIGALFVITMLGGCGWRPVSILGAEPLQSPIPTPGSAPDALRYMRSYAEEERIVGMWTALHYPEILDEAMPLIIANLGYEPNSDVRDSAARVLEQLGPSARGAVPDLIAALQGDPSTLVRIDVAKALGPIGDRSAVPALGEALYADNDTLAIYAAQSIGMLAIQPFPDVDSRGSYRLDSTGNALIVLAAQEWWEREGRYADWSR